MVKLPSARHISNVAEFIGVAFRPIAAFVGATLMVSSAAQAVTVTNPDDTRIEFIGVHPDPPLVEHVPLGNTLSFELDFKNIGATDLDFIAGAVRYLDKNGNEIQPEALINIATFESVVVRDGADETATNGNIPPGQRIFLFFPFENLPHNVVPASVEMELAFSDLADPLLIEDIKIQEYHTPAGQTYIYPTGQNPVIEPMSHWFSGGGHELTTNHRQGGLRFNSTTAWGNQRYAYDIAVFKDPGIGECDDGCDENEDYFVWTEPLHAMGDGTVVLIIQGYEDNPAPSPTPFTPGAGDCNGEPTAGLCNGNIQLPWPCALDEFPGSGNQVVLLHPNGEFSTYAHMMKDSNDHLSCGDSVLQGDEIGKIGMTGTGSNPHNHFSTLTTPGPEADEAENYPVYFNNIKFVTTGETTTSKLQLDVSLPSGTHITEVVSAPSPLPSNPPSPPGPVLEAEPNDTVAQHQTLSLPTTVEGTLETADVSVIAVRGDGIEDIYRVDRGAPSMIQADLFGFDPNQNLDVYGMTENHRILNPVRQGTTQGPTETLCMSVDAGSYYVMVTNTDQTPSAESDYFLQVTAGNAPVISIPGDVDFGDTCVGTTSTQTLEICNTGGDTASCVLDVEEIGSSNPNFSVNPPSSGYPVRISSDFCFPFQAMFSPDGAGQQSVDLTIASNDPLNPEIQVSLSGNGTQPDLNVAIANNGDFGNVCVGSHADLNLTLFNQGQCNVTIDSIVSSNPVFELPANTQYPLVLSPDADFNLPIRFSPTSCNGLAELGTITINSDSPGEEVIVLNVQGRAPCPDLVLDPDPVSGIHAFPATVVDTTGSLGCYSERSVTVRNTGACPATITDISATGADYTVTAPTNFPIVLPPGEETLQATVRFTPQADPDPLAPNAVLGTLSVTSDDIVDPSAQLCGESVAKSGVRILVTDVTSGTPEPIEGVDSLTIQSKGKKTPSPINLMFSDLPVLNADVCGNDIAYHVNLETLPSVGTSGSNPKSSYQAKAMEGNLQTSESFSLGQCEFRDFQLQLQASDPGDGGICLLKPKGDSCTLASECCSGKCKGPSGGKTCK